MLELAAHGLGHPGSEVDDLAPVGVAHGAGAGGHRAGHPARDRGPAALVERLRAGSRGPVARLVRASGVDDRTEISIRRAGAQLNVTTTLSARPGAMATANASSTSAKSNVWLMSFS